jgi:hypothetical protein
MARYRACAIAFAFVLLIVLQIEGRWDFPGDLQII